MLTINASLKSGFLSTKSGKKVEFLSTKVEFLVELCGIFRPQRKTCLTFAASDPMLFGYSVV